MELSIVSRGAKAFPILEVRKDKKEIKGAKKIVKRTVKESMIVNMNPLKFSNSKEVKVEKKEVVLEDSQGKEISIEEDDEWWMVVTHRKKKVDSDPKRNYRRGNKTQKNKKKKKTRKVKLVHEGGKHPPKITREGGSVKRPIEICSSTESQPNLIDNGSAVNIIPKLTMRQLGMLMDELSNSKLVIQGFNKGSQRVIDGVKKVEANFNLFSKAESHFANAKFYLKNDNSPEVVPVEIPLVNRKDNLQLKSLTRREPHKSTGTFNFRKGEASIGTTKSMILMDEKTPNPLILCYVPLSICKKGESSFVESLKGLKVGDIEVLRKSFTTPLTKITKQDIKIDLTEANLP
ncbi:gypsy-like retrotransposase [Cucumis melo var. makuwa]|uniref:Gypsy-like retrotransposase n=1 Tax=Cucumis melo var. makuwa TaxID=1194695 RepID=A0A5D3DA03_CUCMM|nr:gypsy-like retrotransposase [Cucumis melo var. makuwa]TYK20402.1 gypsy-like retrotransposase [Cucumis melo var. makuwa]